MARLGRARPQRNILAFRAVGTSAVLTGTAIAGGVLEAEIAAGGETIIITLNNDTWIAAGSGPIGSTADTQELIDGMDAAADPTNGWNNEVRDKEPTSIVVRTSNTVCTITLTTAAAAYDIASNETITITIPSVVLVTSGIAVTATPTFDITAEAATLPTFYHHYQRNTG